MKKENIAWWFIIVLIIITNLSMISMFYWVYEVLGWNVPIIAFLVLWAFILIPSIHFIQIGVGALTE